MTQKYLIKRIDTKVAGSPYYYKNKCIEAWSRDKSTCWKFTKTGAEKIINRLNKECLNPYIRYEMVNA